jgi:HSP90 family molecular chaperone
MLAKKTLELNPHHSVMKEMLSKVKESSDGKLGEDVEDMARLLFHMALLNSGFNIEDPSDFAGSLGKLINTGFGLSRDQAVE